jgi:hypothetical protein
VSGHPKFDGIPRDGSGSRLRRCIGCGEFRRYERFPEPDGRQCRRCVRRSGRLEPIESSREPKTGAQKHVSDEDVAGRIAAARRLKELVGGDTMHDHEIDAVCGD